MNKLLFPHWVQKVAIWVCIALLAVVFYLTFRAVASDFERDIVSSRAQVSILVTLFYTSIFCCIFSREKREDEFISSMRLRAVAIVAFIAFLSVIVMNVVHVSLPTEKYDAFKEWRMESFWNGKYIMDLAVLYFLIFKLSISRKS